MPVIILSIGFKVIIQTIKIIEKGRCF